MCSGFHTKRKNYVEKLKFHSKSEIFVKLFETEEHCYVKYSRKNVDFEFLYSNSAALDGSKLEQMKI